MLYKKILLVSVVAACFIGTVALAQTDSEPVEMTFANDFSLGVPFQDVYIETQDGMVERPEPGDPLSTLFEPIYGVTFGNPADMEAPFDVGPYEMGEPLGLTFGDWLAARGTGTYTISGEEATIDVEFKNLIPNGLYTLWCVDIDVAAGAMADNPCGPMDGSENEFVADAEGNAHFTMQTPAFPPSTADVFHSIGLAYHSDGQTYGTEPGEFGQNVHIQLFYDFLAPEAE